MRIAVTGAKGRIGSAVLALAAGAGHDTVAIDRAWQSDPASGSVALELSDYDALVAALSGCDALIHLAAIPGPGRHPDHVVHANNVVSSYNALRAAVDSGVPRICQASSVNAIGGRFSSWPPRYDYFPLDEVHPSYAEDPYSLSKWICEQQADALARRYEAVGIASLRFHGVVREFGDTARWLAYPDVVQKQLWGYVGLDATADACLRAVTAGIVGHEVFYIVAPQTMMEVPSLELKERYYPDVPVRGDLDGNRGFFDCSKAATLLGWEHHAM